MPEQRGRQDPGHQPKPEEDDTFPSPNHKHAYVCFGVVFVVCNVAILGFAYRLFQTDTTGHEGRVPAELSEMTQSAITHALMDAADEMKKKMNPSVHPCQDFYDYACGGWHHMETVDKSDKELSFFTILQTITDKKILAILRQKFHESDMPYLVKPRQFFAACNNTERLALLGSSPFLKFIKSIGKFPILEPSWKESDFKLQDMVTALAQLGFPVLFKLTIAENGKYMILSPDTYTLVHNGLAYYDWTSMTLAYLRLDARVGQNLLDIQQMFDVEAAIYEIKANLERAQRNTPLDKAKDMKISELQQKVPWLNWLEFFRELDAGAGLVDNPITADDFVIVGNHLFLVQLYHNVLNRFSKRALANFLMKSLLIYTSALDSRYMTLPAYIETSVGKPLMDRATRCLMETKRLFPELVSRLYVDQHYSDEITPAVKTMFQHIKNSYMDSMNKTIWLTSNSKAKSKRKVALMSGKIGYSECLDNINFLNGLYRTVSTGEYFDAVKDLARLRASNLIARHRSGNLQNKCWQSKTAFDIGAINDIHHNALYFSAANLQPPVYNQRWPLSMQYSGAGFLIAHDVMHALDSKGHQYNEAGVPENWFSKEDSIVFAGKMRCLITQYSDYKFYDKNISGSATLDENLCDYQGLMESFKAYKQAVKLTMTDDLLLPGVNLTADQIFFTNYAQMLCQHIPPKMRAEAVGRSFAPNRFRVIGTLQNSYEFAETFSCRLHSPMHPQTKCSMLS